MDVDLKAMIERLVEREKEYIREDRGDYGCAMAVVVTPEKTYLDFPKFDDDDSKRAAYEHLVHFAKEKTRRPLSRSITHGRALLNIRAISTILVRSKLTQPTEHHVFL